MNEALKDTAVVAVVRLATVHGSTIVEREVISVTERDIKMLKYWLTSGRYGKTVSQYFSNDELPNYDACEVGRPMYQSEAIVQVKQGEEIPF